MSVIINRIFCLIGWHRFSCVVEQRRIITRKGGLHIRNEFKPKCGCCNKEFKWIKQKYFKSFCENHMYKANRTKLNK